MWNQNVVPHKFLSLHAKRDIIKKNWFWFYEEEPFAHIPMLRDCEDFALSFPAEEGVGGGERG